MLGGLYGMIFALLVAPRAATPGAGLLWGLGYALLLWLAGPSACSAAWRGARNGHADTARAHFPELLAYVLLFGLPLGLTLGTWGSLRPRPNRARFSLPRALVVGARPGSSAAGPSAMDGADQLLPDHRRSGGSDPRGRRRAAFRDRDSDRDELRALFQRDVRG